MFFKRIETPGLAHYAYIIGEGKEVAVIDPTRNVSQCLDEVNKAGLVVGAIFETHRNEDIISGGRELAEKTGAICYISGHEDLGYKYGEKIMDGDKIKVGDLTIEAIHTPGHTLGHMSYAVYEEDRDVPYAVFTGDCLFMGEVGRTDFYGEDMLVEMTEKLYHSIFDKLLPLGDLVQVLPAHGSGSACGAEIEDRPFTTIGYEKKNNESLQAKNKSEFVEKNSITLPHPRYFKEVEKYNVEGGQHYDQVKTLPSLTIDESRRLGAIIVDTRSKEAYYGGHIKGAICLEVGAFPDYIGSLYSTDQKLALVCQNDDMNTIVGLYDVAKKIGFDNILGYIPNPVEALVDTDESLERMGSVNGQEFAQVQGDYILLDVRNESELQAEDPTKNRINIALQELYKKYTQVPTGKDLYVLCESGQRASVAASYMKEKGYDPTVIQGGARALRAEIK